MGKMTKVAPWPASIQGDLMHVYFVDFPLTAIIKPPEGWEFFQIRKHRQNCQDECWRVRYRRAALSQGGGE